MSWNGDLSPEEAKKNIEIYLTEAWKRGPSENDYLTKAFIEFFIGTFCLAFFVFIVFSNYFYIQHSQFFWLFFVYFHFLLLFKKIKFKKTAISCLNAFKCLILLVHL